MKKPRPETGNRAQELLSEYRKRGDEIRARLEDFRARQRGSDLELFSELCFCLFTPQSKALACDRAVRELKRSGALRLGEKREVASKMHGVRFKNQKAGFLIEARRRFLSPGRGLKNKIREPVQNREMREWLVKNVKGLGYKEASHFLRNVGMGENLAILDRHILKNLLLCGVVDEIPRSLTRKRYLEIEKKMLDFSQEIGIPMEELDLLFWSRETGKVFK
jgi:N-glycosylase/DNA lyase